MTIMFRLDQSKVLTDIRNIQCWQKKKQTETNRIELCFILQTFYQSHGIIYGVCNICFIQKPLLARYFVVVAMPLPFIVISIVCLVRLCPVAHALCIRSFVFVFVFVECLSIMQYNFVHTFRRWVCVYV